MLGSVLPVNAAESLETFDYETYADTYPDLKAAFGYDAAALYNHYETIWKGRGQSCCLYRRDTGSTADTDRLAATDHYNHRDT